MLFGQVDYTKMKDTELEELLEKTNSELQLAIDHKMPQSFQDDLANRRQKISDALNKKEKNKFHAVTFVYNGIKFDSKREAECAQILDLSGLTYQRQVKFELIKPTVLDEEGTVRGTYIKVDFVVDNWIIDIKGMVTKDFELKWKMLKSLNGNAYKYRLVTSKKDFDAVVLLIKRELINGIKISEE